MDLPIRLVSFFLLFLLSFQVAKTDEVLERIIAMEYLEPRTKLVEGFSNYGGEWTVDAEGVLSVDAGSGHKLVLDDPKFENMSEGEVSVDIFCPGNHNDTNAGILTKVRDAATGADNFIGYEIAIRPEHGELNVGKHRFNYEQINRTRCKIANERWINLRVAFTGRTMEIFIDDDSVFKYEDEDATLLSGGIALRPWQRAAKYRDLRVKSVGDAEWTSIPFVPVKFEPTKSYPETLAVEKLPPLLVLVRHPLHRPPAVGQDLMQGQFEPGCSIRLIHPADPKTPTRTIYSDPGGNIYDMNLSIDAKTVYFSHRKHGEKNYSLWKIGVDGSGLERLTEGTHCDVSPCEVPGGGIWYSFPPADSGTRSANLARHRIFTG